MNIKRYLKLYPRFVLQFMKSLMEYRLDFFMGLIGFFFLQCCGVIFISLVFTSIPALDGWQFYEILFIYGFAQIPRGLDHVFTDNLWLLAGWLIAKGEMDRFLVRPLNPLFPSTCRAFPAGLVLENFFIGVITSPFLQETKTWALHFSFVQRVHSYHYHSLPGSFIIHWNKAQFATSFSFLG